jgi:hypothetical protein
MGFIVTPIEATTADGIAAWCGIDTPTPAESIALVLAANAAESVIRHYRKLDTAPAWFGLAAYVLGDVRQPTHENGHLYKCTTAGTSDDTEPVWPTTEGSTVTDGTVVWTEYVRPFETKYQSLAIEIGVYLYSKRGVDGTTSFSENGVARTFETGSIPPSMLARISLPTVTG